VPLSDGVRVQADTPGDASMMQLLQERCARLALTGDSADAEAAVEAPWRGAAEAAALVLARRHGLGAKTFGMGGD